MKLNTNELLAGKVAIVGAGPSDPELMTLRAFRLLERADVILIDHLVDHSVLACAPHARVIDVGKNPAGKSTSQEVINALLVKEARGDNFVVRLKGGDPFVFGRGGEEAIYLAEHGIGFEVVPGVSSSVAAPQAAGIPVTHRGVSTHFSVITGHGADGIETLKNGWTALAQANGTLVFLMGVKNAAHIVKAVLAGGRAPTTPCAFIQAGTSQSQVVLESTLEFLVRDAQAAGIKAPATLVVGEVVSLRNIIAAVSQDMEPLISVG